jgi:hypothetical protein
MLHRSVCDTVSMDFWAEAAEYWRCYLANDAQSEWAARARRSLKFCEMQMHVSFFLR